MSGKKFRILCFHGYRQNEALFREKTGSMRKLFKSTAEFEFLSAPLIPNVPDDDTRENSRGWWFSKPQQQFSSRDVCNIADGFDQSVEETLDFIKINGPFDGLLGFSQGASMVHLLLAMEKLGRAHLDMGNNMGIEEGEARKNFLNNGSGAAPKFRVYIHRRNRVIHAWLRILPDQIQLEPETKTKQKAEMVSWPLNLIRRYGYTSAGVFFFESGRRCPTGEGLHCFQTQYADTVFHLVQQRVQENANVAQSQCRESSMRGERAKSSAPDLHTEIDRGRINPLQRFGSEGTCVSNDYKLPRSGSSWSPVSLSSRKFRQNVLQPASRPRSATFADGSVTSLPTYIINKDSNQLGSKIVGNIISESTNPSAGREDFDLMTLPRHLFPDPIPPTYVNITPISDGNGVAFKFHRARTNSSSSVNSLPTSPVTAKPNVIPIKWDVAGCSASLLCHVPSTDNFTRPTSSYVNLHGARKVSAPPSTQHFAPGMNYADVSLNQTGTSRTSTSSIPANYATIDSEKTKALQNAALERKLEKKRHGTAD